MNNLDLCRKLAEYFPNAENWWVKPFDVNMEFTGDELEVESQKWLDYLEMNKAKAFPCPNLEEVLNVLPKEIEGRGFHITYTEEDGWIVYYAVLIPMQGIFVKHERVAKSLINALMKMLEYLHDNGLMK